MTPKNLALSQLLVMVRRVAWSARSGLVKTMRVNLREALHRYDLDMKRKTSFDHVLGEDDLFESSPGLPKCPTCDNPFLVKRANQRFCSSSCRRRYWNTKKGAPGVVPEDADSDGGS